MPLFKLKEGRGPGGEGKAAAEQGGASPRRLVADEGCTFPSVFLVFSNEKKSQITKIWKPPCKALNSRCNFYFVYSCQAACIYTRPANGQI